MILVHIFGERSLDNCTEPLDFTLDLGKKRTLRCTQIFLFGENSLERKIKVSCGVLFLETN
jgi:hypothetical protein